MVKKKMNKIQKKKVKTYLYYLMQCVHFIIFQERQKI